MGDDTFLDESIVACTYCGKDINLDVDYHYKVWIELLGKKHTLGIYCKKCYKDFIHTSGGSSAKKSRRKK